MNESERSQFTLTGAQNYEEREQEPMTLKMGQLRQDVINSAMPLGHYPESQLGLLQEELQLGNPRPQTGLTGLRRLR